MPKEGIWAEKPKARTSPVMDVIGISSYDNPEMDAWLEKLKVEYDLLKEHSGRWLHFLAVSRPESLSPQKLMELKEKAEKYDMLEKSVPLVDHLNFEQIVNEHKALEDKLEAVRKLVASGPLLNVDTLEECQQAVDDWLGKIMTVLEAEE